MFPNAAHTSCADGVFRIDLGLSSTQGEGIYALMCVLCALPSSLVFSLYR